jgi:hypothetical protein
VITYNFEGATNRQTFVNAFEEALVGLRFHKEQTNQSTYFGSYRDKQSLATDLLNATGRLNWSVNDIVTIYYPKATLGPNGNYFADIGRHGFKTAGVAARNPNIIDI